MSSFETDSYVVARDDGYGLSGFSDEYLQCIEKNFENENFAHFIGYVEKNPVAIASIGRKEGVGGLYNVGAK